MFTVNGFGERVGNAALGEVVAFLAKRQEQMHSVIGSSAWA